MLKKLTLSSLLVLSLGATAQTKSLEDRVSELEATQSLNIFSFSGTLMTQYDHIEAKQTQGASYDNKVDYMRLLSFLNVDANVNENIKFYSRYTVSKFFNNISNQAGTTAGTNFRVFDIGIARSYSGSQVYVERAYADMKMSDSLILSAGRLSTFDGPPNHLPHGKSRMGTYPALVYNTNLDGAALTYNHELNTDSSLSTRVVYSPLYSYTYNVSGVPMYQGQPTTDNNGTTGDKLPSSSAIAAWMLEYNLKNSSAFNNFTVIYQGIAVNNLNIYAAQLPSITHPLAGVLTPTGRITATYGLHSVTFDMAGVAKSNLDLGLSFVSSEMKNTGAISYGGTPSVFGYGASAQDEVAKSTTSLVSLRYKYTNNDFVGYEHLNGSKNNFIFDLGSEDLTNFQATPGTGSHVYLLHKFSPELGLRVGYRQQQYKYAPMTIGATTEIDRKVNTAYANLRLDF